VPEQTEPQKIRLTLSPQAERYARRDAPREARLMAARGALPLPPLELATVLFVLHHDPDPEIKSTARESLESLPDSVCDTVLSGPAHPALLSHLAHAFKDDAGRLERIALNPAADDATLAFLASAPFVQIVEIISHNEERMLRAPEIVDALGANRLTGRSVIDRILSFLEVERDAGDADDGATTPEAISDAKAEAALRAVLGEEMAAFARQLVEESDGEADQDNRDLSLYSVIQNMTVFQKIRLGRMGNKEARGLLVRDRNKIVAIASITSPRITDNEVVSISQSRNVCEDVLRMISMSREWTRNYQVKLGLATNPKCPLPAAVKFVNYLQDKDLRQIMRSKDVPSAVATHARRILMKKGRL
jgi:hypothetical protein